MKEPLRGIRFRTVPEILQAVDRSIRTINRTGAAKGILRLPHRWQRQSSGSHKGLSPCDFHLIPKMKEPLRHKGLSPCDFHLIPKMKKPLRDIRFRTVPEILQAVDRSIRTINTTGSAKGILRLPYRWQRVVHNAGDNTEGQ